LGIRGDIAKDPSSAIKLNELDHSNRL